VTKSEYCYTTRPSYFDSFKPKKTDLCNNPNNQNKDEIRFEVFMKSCYNSDNDDDVDEVKDVDKINKKINKQVQDDLRGCYMVDDVVSLCKWDLYNDKIVCVSFMNETLYLPPFLLNGEKYHVPVIELRYQGYDFDFKYDSVNIIKNIILINKNTNKAEIYNDHKFSAILKQVCVLNLNLTKNEYFAFYTTAHSSESSNDVAKRLQPLDTVLTLGKWKIENENNQENNQKNNDVILQVTVDFFNDTINKSFIDINTLYCTDMVIMSMIKDKINFKVQFLNDKMQKFFNPKITLKKKLCSLFFQENNVFQMFNSIHVELINYKKRKRFEQNLENKRRKTNKKVNNTDNKNNKDNSHFDSTLNVYDCKTYTELECIYDYTYSFI
jgi:hypothetical protein